MICRQSNAEFVMVKQGQGGVLRVGSAWAEATSRTSEEAERGLAGV